MDIKEQFFQDLRKWRFQLRNAITSSYSQKYSLTEIELFTQKILDRLIFIDYCADNHIITQDRLHAILHTKGNLWKELVRIFAEMDEKFNSELFSYNEINDFELKDSVMAPIINELANINFSKLTVNVMGEVYENYLGELLKNSKKSTQLDLDKSTKKKKEQGIYYTPDFIVDYIVENTLGSILKKCKTIEEIERIRVIDPACGSGSFLIRAFDEFLKHYERIKPSGLFHFEIRRNILTKNLYGVDLDERAVEIAKLNLLVKALEGSAATMLKGRKLLPNLKLNIRCGNSLISGENKEGELSFNYTIAFPEVFSDGGFDCVIGNPPYGYLFTETEVFYYLNSSYITAEYKVDAYTIFTEKGVSILKENGTLGFIIPYTFITGKYFSKMRKFIGEFDLVQLFLLGKKIFHEADVDTSILLIQKTKPKKHFYFADIRYEKEHINLNHVDFHKIEKAKAFSELEKRILVGSREEINLYRKIQVGTIKLGSVVEFYHGIQSRGDDNAISLVKPSEKKNMHYKLLKGSDFNKYRLNPLEKYFHYKKEKIKSGGDLKYHFAPEKIIIRTTGDSIVATYDNSQYLVLNSVNIAIPISNEVNLKYVLGIINSSLVHFWYRMTVQESEKTFAEVKIVYLKEIPFPNPSKYKTSLNKMVGLVDRLLGDSKAKKSDKNSIEFDSILQQIDQLVYELYGLTTEEITIVEGVAVSTVPRKF